MVNYRTSFPENNNGNRDCNARFYCAVAVAVSTKTYSDHAEIVKMYVNKKLTSIFTYVGLRLLEGRVLHKEVWIATLLGIQDYKKVKFPGTRPW